MTTPTATSPTEIQAQQHELDLERQSQVLLDLCRQENQDWVAAERGAYEEVQRSSHPEELARALAEPAAQGGLPVQRAYWTEQLLDLLKKQPELLEPVRRSLVRLCEACPHRRPYLLDRIAAHHWVVA